jgi:hypothetical protein
MTETEKWWVAVSYGPELTEEEWRHETWMSLDAGEGYPSCVGYCGELELDGEWHSLWVFTDRKEADRFRGDDRIFTLAQLEELAATGHYRSLENNLPE